jgi:hypothetical protein
VDKVVEMKNMRAEAGCKVVAVRVDDMAPNGDSFDRATVRQRKTGRPVCFELMEQTREAPDDDLRLTARKAGDALFSALGAADRGLATHQYARSLGERTSRVRS